MEGPAVTHPNAALLRRYIDALLAGDAPAAVAFYADDMVMHIGGRSPHAGTYHGPEGYLDFVTRVHQDTDGGVEILDIHDVLGTDDHAVLLVRERFSRNGRSVETERVVVYELRDEQIVEIWNYDSDQYAYDELFADVAPIG
jgi:ketosteroid isomerase-like protein